LYPWRQIGTSAEPTGHPATRRPDVAYYLSPAEKGGEPPGRWRGAGLAELGFRDGQLIDRPVFESLYGEFADPRDPSGETRLGRAAQRFRSADEIHAALLALEPEATAERQAELLIEAKQQVRLPVQYFDVTFSVSKSITLLHASALANALQADALDYLQREAGYTRSGYHGRQINGISSGRWEDAHQFVIGSFPQHTSRDGDPQLHIHNLALNRVQRERDGAWRTLDSKALYEHRGAASAIAALVMESALSREFGVEWIQRPDGHGREIAGVKQALMEQFSSRRQSISALTRRLARAFEEQHGHKPDARALGQLRQWANHASRARKGAEPLDLAAEVRRWAEQARSGEAGALEPVMPSVSTRRGAAKAAAKSADKAQAEPRELFEPTPEQLRDVMSALTAAEWPVVPDSLRRADGQSVYRPHGATMYATLAQLTTEDQLIAQAQERGAPSIPPDQAARQLGATQAQLQAQLGATTDSVNPVRADGGDQATGKVFFI
jgi:conjugative relaxase-like TrwC/TraI family protein